MEKEMELEKKEKKETKEKKSTTSGKKVEDVALNSLLKKIQNPLPKVAFRVLSQEEFGAQDGGRWNFVPILTKEEEALLQSLSEKKKEDGKVDSPDSERTLAKEFLEDKKKDALDLLQTLGDSEVKKIEFLKMGINKKLKCTDKSQTAHFLQTHFDESFCREVGTMLGLVLDPSFHPYIPIYIHGDWWDLNTLPIGISKTLQLKD